MVVSINNFLNYNESPEFCTGDLYVIESALFLWLSGEFHPLISKRVSRKWGQTTVPGNEMGLPPPHTKSNVPLAGGPPVIPMGTFSCGKAFPDIYQQGFEEKWGLGGVTSQFWKWSTDLQLQMSHPIVLICFNPKQYWNFKSQYSLLSSFFLCFLLSFFFSIALSFDAN